MNKPFDIRIENGDIAESLSDALYLNGREAITQDVQHAILESGLLPLLVAERSDTGQRDILNRILLVMEDDRRIIPGTARTVPVSGRSGLFIFTATTYEYGQITLGDFAI